MKKRKKVLPIVVAFILFSVLLFFFSSNGLFSPARRVIEWVFLPIQKIVVLAKIPGSSDTENKKLKEENIRLTKQLVHLRLLEKENKALRDQFETTQTKNQQLLPASIVGAPAFIPGVTVPDRYILDKGKDDGVAVGQAVVYQNNFVGVITQVSNTLSSVLLLVHKEFVQTVTVVPTSTEQQTTIFGVLHGRGGNEMTVENILQSAALRMGDVVVTSGEKTMQGSGMPAHIIIGKITSIEKKPSDLYQIAKVKSVLDFTALSTVFIVTENK